MATATSSAPEPPRGKWTKLFLEVGSTGVWQAIGKLAQVFGLLHATNCLGRENAGISAGIMGTAMMLQVVLTLGIDVVAVRHVSAKTQPLDELVTLIFSGRLVLHGIVTLLWSIGVWLAPLTPAETLAWWIGGIYFLVIGMNYQWYYQATSQMPALSRIQTLATLAISAYFLLAFKDGAAAGTDLLVMAIGHGGVTLWVWYRIRKRTPNPMFTWRFATGTLKLLKEGQANWLFGVLYNALTLFGLLLIPRLIPGEDGRLAAGAFHASNQLVLALQYVLVYVGYIFYPRIVTWQREHVPDFNRRVFGLAGLAWACGCLSALLVYAIGEPVFQRLFKPEFYPGFQILPVMVLAKFVGTASGFLTWGLLAAHRDWLAVRCCLIPVCIAFILHLVYVPAHGFVAAGWLYLAGECLLFACCAAALLKIRSASP